MSYGRFRTKSCYVPTGPRPADVVERTARNAERNRNILIATTITLAVLPGVGIMAVPFTALAAALAEAERKNP